ncbi:MAG: zinc ribbon domain-containing protein [Alphaproteobacteria bacterium]|nr:zinc ribbon domain-containing protein [Alphaproteobacteria bacterium]
MPMYSFKCSDCETVFDVLCSISARAEQECPNCKSTNYEFHHTTPLNMGDPIRLGVRKTDDGFKEVLSKINSSNGRKANLADKLSRR